jgi:hypothetical protein
MKESSYVSIEMRVIPHSCPLGESGGEFGHAE